MKYALVRDDVIENLIELDPDSLVEVPPSETTDAWSGLVTKHPGRPAWQSPEGSSVYPVDGVPVERGWAWNDGAPAPVPRPGDVVLSEAKARAVAEVGAAYDAAINAGLSFDGKTYQIDTFSQNRILARAVVARACLDGNGEWPEDFGWIATDNTRPMFTAEEFWTFANDAQMRVTAITLNARSLKDAVLAAADLDALQAVDVQGGW